jgi:CrcB protein
VARRLGARFPWGTLVVNLSGCLLAGLVAALFLRATWTATGRPLLAVGFLAPTPRSRPSSWRRSSSCRNGQRGHAAAYVAISLCAGLLAVWLGWALGRAMWR